jgi:ketosteroid isomerase-like protein
MRLHALLLLLVTLVAGCTGSEAADGGGAPAGRAAPGGRPFRQLTVTQDRPSPNVDITRYVVVAEDPEAVRADAAAIMRVKAAWPLAMQTKDEALFERILARDFTFRAEEEFRNRADYIRDRVNPAGETVAAARYENLVLQFFGDVALLTYRNAIDITRVGGTPATLRLSWADVYVREQGEWKIGGSHLVDLQEMGVPTTR